MSVLSTEERFFEANPQQNFRLRRASPQEIEQAMHAARREGLRGYAPTHVVSARAKNGSIYCQLFAAEMVSLPTDETGRRDGKFDECIGRAAWFLVAALSPASGVEVCA